MSRPSKRRSRLRHRAHIARKVEAIATNVIIPSSGYLSHLDPVPISPVYIVRNRISIVLISGTAESPSLFIDEKSDFDGIVRVGSRYPVYSATNHVYFFIELDQLGQCALSKLHRINYTNPENHTLNSYRRGLVAVKKVSLTIPIKHPDIIPVEGTISYRTIRGTSTNSARTEATESGAGKLPFAKLELPRMDWLSIGYFNTLVDKPRLQLVLEVDRNLELVNSAGHDFTLCYLDTTIAYRFDPTYGDTARTLRRFTGGADFTSQMKQAGYL